MAKRTSPRDKARAAARQKLRSLRLQINAIQTSLKALESLTKELEISIEESAYQEQTNATKNDGET